MVMGTKGLGPEKDCALACIKDRPVLSSERAPHRKQNRNTWTWTCSSLEFVADACTITRAVALKEVQEGEESRNTEHAVIQ
jgi:hypothetical protein